jgi:hypothetical protein
VLVTVSITTSAHVATHVVAIHLHVGFRTLSRVATISTVRATIRECRAGKSAGSHKGRSTKDRWQAVPNAVEA